MFSSTSFAGWTKVGKNVDGTTFYVDFESIKKHDGYVYFWELQDWLEPTSSGILSVKIYEQVDCKKFRYKNLSWSGHTEPMGGGTGEIDNTPDKEWTYPSPDSVGEITLKSVCQYANRWWGK